MKNAVAYTRFSSEMQRDESIEAQVRAKQGLKLIHVYADRGISGTKDARPEFQNMISACKKKETRNFDTVIVHKLDRFARNRYDSAIYIYIKRKWS